MKSQDAREVEISVLEIHPGRPPLVRLGLDVKMHNVATGPRWFILPANLPVTSGGGVNGLEVAAVEVDGRVVVGRFLGNGGFQALLLPGGATVRVRGLPLSYWGDLPESVLHLDAVVARGFTLGGDPAQTWFPDDPTCAASADVDFSKARALSSRKTPDYGEVPVTIDVDRLVGVEIKLTRLAN